MANNEHINKVVKSTGETLIDLTSDTVAPETLLQGETAHDRSGAAIRGTAVIPTVNDGTLTIQQNGTTKATFTANQSANVTANIETGDAYGIDMYDDTLPIDITARGDNLEDWVIYGNDEVGKNLLDLSGLSNATTNGVTFTVDAAAGTITAVRTGTQSSDAIFFLAIPSTVYGNMYMSGCADGGSLNTYDIFPYDITTSARPKDWSGETNAEGAYNSSDYVEVKFVEGHSSRISIRIRADATFTSLVFKPMIRAANTTPEFEPYHLGIGQLNSAGTGYELPIVTKQTGKADITTYIYLGTMPLTDGQSLSKSQATTKDIPTYNGECTIDATYPNKPRMEIIPTDSAINIINKLKGCMPLSGGVMTGSVEWISEIVGINYVPSSHRLLIYNAIADYGNIDISSQGNLDIYASGELELQNGSGNFAIGEHKFVMNLPDENSENYRILRMTYGVGSELVINSDGYVAKLSSSREIKHDIEYIEDTKSYHDALMQIKPATYVYNNDKTETTKLGMIAEDVADVMPIAALTDESGKVENYDTRAIIAMLVMEVQRLNAEIERLRGDSDAN